MTFYDLKELLPPAKVVKRALLNMGPKIQRPYSKTMKLPTKTPEEGQELSAHLSKTASLLA